MTGVLFTGGLSPDFSTIKNIIMNADIIAAADSGFDSAVKMGIKPDIIIGDMDSVKNTNLLSEYPEDRILKFLKDKDETDTELGLLYLSQNKCDNIILIGGGGGRMDHFLGIVFLFDRDLSPNLWYTNNTRFEKITGYNKIHSMKGKLVSFFPLGNVVCKMKSDGLKWPLDKLNWDKGDMGISNIVTKDPFSVEMTNGSLLMVNQIKDVLY